MTIRAQNLSMKVSICKEKKEEGFRLFLIPFDCCRSIILCVVKSPHFLQKAKSNFLFSQISFVFLSCPESEMRVSWTCLSMSLLVVVQMYQRTAGQRLEECLLKIVFPTWRSNEGKVLTNDCREKESEIRVNTQGKRSQVKQCKNDVFFFCCFWFSNQQLCWDRINKFWCPLVGSTVEVI